MAQSKRLVGIAGQFALITTVVASLVILYSPLNLYVNAIAGPLFASLVSMLLLRRQILAILNESDQRQERLKSRIRRLNHAALVSETDASGTIIYINNLFMQIAGYGVDELAGRNHNCVNSGFHDKQFWQDFWETLRIRGIWRGEICNKAKDGSIFWVYCTIREMRDTNGQLRGYSSVGVNITERKQAEFRETSRHNRIIDYNATLTSLIRHPSLIGQKYDELLHELPKIISSTLGVQRVSIWTLEQHDSEQYINLISMWNNKTQTVESGTELYEKDFPSYFSALNQERLLIYNDVYAEPDLKEFTEQYFPSSNITAMLDAPFYQSGQVAGVICLEHVDSAREWQLEEQAFIISVADILTIIYESKRLHLAEESLKHAEKLEALGKLTSGIAHDFNNMLGVIMGYADLLVNSLQQDPVQLKYAKQIQTASQRGAKMTANLLSFSRRKKVDPTLVQLDEFLQAHHEMIQKTLTVSIRLNHVYQADIWPVKLDESDLEHVLLNLCINAMHAMEETDTPTLTLRLTNHSLSAAEQKQLELTGKDYVIFEVRDNGCGISPESLPRVFDPFYSTKGDKGTGLGLAQVFGFMKRSEGTITVNSKPGKGTSFKLYFPRCEAQLEQREDVSVIESTEIQSAGDKKHILVVDDEKALAHLASEILNGAGYRTSVAESAIKALEILMAGTSSGL